MLSEHIFFIIERIADILKHEEEKMVELSDVVKSGLGQLKKEVLRIYGYLRIVESKSDDNPHEEQFYLNLSCIVDSSDDILDRVSTNDDSSDETIDSVTIAHDIDTLIEKIRNSYNPSSTQFKVNVVVKDNVSSGGPQNIANLNFSINQSKPSKDNKDSRQKILGHYRNPHLVGFNQEIETLLNHLLQTSDVTRFVGIVGMGGSGKTTLAKHIYHHPDIKTHFARKVWVCVSQSGNKTSVLNSIWRKATGKTTTGEMDYDEVAEDLSLFLSSGSYLVILDDIWSIDIWNHIYQAFPGEGRNAIVVTTRRKDITKTINDAIFIVEPRQLNDEDSYKLFKLIAPVLVKNTPHDLLSLGMEMVKKCKGLPLAIITLAGVLQMNNSRSTWERISKRLIPHILTKKDASKEGVVKEVLALSYDELPHRLKPCALYLHVFPEDDEIKAQKLIQMWVAESFTDEESTAEGYLEEMVQRCIVEVVKTNCEGKVLEFRIHDLIRQMFIDIDKERNFLKSSSPLRLVPRTTTLYGDEQKSYESRMEVLLGYLYASSHVRSLIFLNFRDLENLILRPLFMKLKVLRVLILDDIPWNELPKEIGNLIHLRYLELSGSPYDFPQSIENLENLRTLDIRYLHTSTTQINFEKMKELRHLYMSTRLYHSRKIMKIDLMGLEKLKKLKTLWGVKGGKWMLSAMPQLDNSLQELYVWGIGKQKELEVVFKTPSISSNNLHTLVLQWFGSQLRDMSILRKCTNLKKLKLNGKIEVGTTIMFPSNLIHLEMINTSVEEKQVLNIISELCPQLKILTFQVAFFGKELVCNQNSFPQLEKLALINLDHLDWLIIESDAMPRLDHLIIGDSISLDLNVEGWKRIPHIPKLTFLKYSYATTFNERVGECRKDWIHCIKNSGDWSPTELD